MASNERTSTMKTAWKKITYDTITEL